MRKVRLKVPHETTEERVDKLALHDESGGLKGFETNVESRIISTIGAQERYEPTKNLADGHNEESLAHREELQEHRSARRKLEEQAADHESASQTQALYTGVQLIEAVACCHLALMLGVDYAHALLFGIMLAALLFHLTHCCATVAGRTAKAVVIWTCYGVVVLAIAAVRLAVLPTDLPTWFNAAAAVVFAALTVGPAWVAEHLRHQLEATVPLARKLRLMRNRERKLQNRIDVAVARRTAVGASRRWWDALHETLYHRYRAAFLRQRSARNRAADGHQHPLTFWERIRNWAATPSAARLRRRQP